MRIIITILSAIIIFSSCNPAKQLLKAQAQFDSVGVAWAKKNPCVNDSSVQSNTADTILKYLVSTDTAIHTDTVTNVKTITLTKTVTASQMIYDTVKIAVADKRTEDAWHTSSDAYQAADNADKVTIATLQKYKWICFIGFPLLLILFGIIYFKTKN